MDRFLVMKNVFFVLFFALSFATLVVAENDAIGIDVAFQVSAIKLYTDSSSVFHERYVGIGGRVGYYLGKNTFLDGEISYEPRGIFATNARTIKTIILGGARLGIWNDVFGIYAKARAGTINFEEGSPHISPSKNAYPLFDVGIIGERYFERNFFVRFDIGYNVIPFGDAEYVHLITIGDTEYINHPKEGRVGTKHYSAASFGFGFRF